MCALRVVLITVMSITVVVAMYRDAQGLSEGGDFGKYSGGFDSSPSVGSFFRPLGIFQMFPIVIFAQALHPSAGAAVARVAVPRGHPCRTHGARCASDIPVIVQPIRDKNRAHMVFRYCFMATGILYCSAGVLVSLYFGDKVQNSANINWQYYNGGTLVVCSRARYALGARI